MRRVHHPLPGIVAAMLGLALAGCSSTKNPLPPPFVGSAVDNPVSCAELQSGQIVGKEIHLDGGVPSCGATGLHCPLAGVAPSVQASVCGSRTLAAACEQGQWKIVCETPVDASTYTNAGDAAASDAHGDATPD